MGLLWWRRNDNSQSKSNSQSSTEPDTNSAVPGMNGAMEVPRPPPPPPPPSDVAVFEFGSVANSADKVTVAGYCPVSDDLEPCRWEIIPAEGSNAPQFRIVF